jgi:hypothetical protein
VLSFLAGLATAYSERCLNRGERWIERGKWWLDVAKWIELRDGTSFAEIRAARKAVKS